MENVWKTVDPHVFATLLLLLLSLLPLLWDIHIFFFFPKILPAISVAAFTSARQITGQPVAIKITARQLSPQIVRNSKNVASTRATTQNNKQTRVVVCCPVLCREFMAQNTQPKEPNLSHTNSICLHFNCRLSPQQTKKKISREKWPTTRRQLSQQQMQHIHSIWVFLNFIFYYCYFFFCFEFYGLILRISNAVNSFVRGCVKYFLWLTLCAQQSFRFSSSRDWHFWL